MARPKKYGQYLNVKIDTGIYHRLEEYCLDSGYTKTTSVERALTLLIDTYEADKETLRKIADGSVKLVENKKR